MTFHPTPSSADPDGRAVAAPFSRRVALAGLASLGAAAVMAACSSNATSSGASSAAAGSTGAAGSTSTASTSTGSTSTASTSASASSSTPGAATGSTAVEPATPDTSSCVVIPEETAGPYPGDGSNGPNVLADPGIVRADIRSSYGSSTTIADGVALTIELTITDSANGCSPISGAAVYAWHCNANGEYSLYSANVTAENYLRGVQEADANGVIRFTSIFPAAYAGRWPHVHFEVYPSLAAAADVGNQIATSQIALPQDTCDLVYADSARYPTSARNLSQISISSDNVFGDDGGVHEMATMSGSVADGFTAALTAAV